MLQKACHHLIVSLKTDYSSLLYLIKWTKTKLNRFRGKCLSIFFKEIRRLLHWILLSFGFYHISVCLVICLFAVHHQQWMYGLEFLEKWWSVFQFHYIIWNEWKIFKQWKWKFAFLFLILIILYVCLVFCWENQNITPLCQISNYLCCYFFQIDEKSPCFK